MRWRTSSISSRSITASDSACASGSAIISSSVAAGPSSRAIGSSSPRGVRSTASSRCTCSRGSSVAAARSSVDGSCPWACRWSSRVSRIRARPLWARSDSTAACVRSETSCCIACRTHQQAYAQKGAPSSGSKRPRARSRPTTPSCSSSSRPTPTVLRYRRATPPIAGRYASTSSRRASGSPAAASATSRRSWTGLIPGAWESLSRATGRSRCLPGEIRSSVSSAAEQSMTTWKA